jgi:hypothetical protein
LEKERESHLTWPDWQRKKTKICCSLVGQTNKKSKTPALKKNQEKELSANQDAGLTGLERNSILKHSTANQISRNKNQDGTQK